VNAFHWHLPAQAEIEAMKARLKEMEDEAARLRASQQQVCFGG